MTFVAESSAVFVREEGERMEEMNFELRTHSAAGGIFSIVSLEYYLGYGSLSSLLYTVVLSTTNWCDLQNSIVSALCMR